MATLEERHRSSSCVGSQGREQSPHPPPPPLRAGACLGFCSAIEPGQSHSKPLFVAGGKRQIKTMMRHTTHLSQGLKRKIATIPNAGKMQKHWIILTWLVRRYNVQLSPVGFYKTKHSYHTTQHTYPGGTYARETNLRSHANMCMDVHSIFLLNSPKLARTHPFSDR